MATQTTCIDPFCSNSFALTLFTHTLDSTHTLTHTYTKTPVHTHTHTHTTYTHAHITCTHMHTDVSHIYVDILVIQQMLLSRVTYSLLHTHTHIHTYFHTHRIRCCKSLYPYLYVQYIATSMTSYPCTSTLYW
jgi:hypothetical protein